MSILDELNAIDTMTEAELHVADERYHLLSDYASRRISALRLRVMGETRLAEGQEAAQATIREMLLNEKV